MVPVDQLVAYYRAIWNLDATELKRLKIPIKAVTLRDRNAAGEWLTDRGYGKAPAHAPVEGENPLDLETIDVRIGEIVDELAGRREAAPVSESANDSLADAG